MLCFITRAHVRPKPAQHNSITPGARALARPSVHTPRTAATRRRTPATATPVPSRFLQAAPTFAARRAFSNLQQRRPCSAVHLATRTNTTPPQPALVCCTPSLGIYNINWSICKVSLLRAENWISGQC